ncbi:hypothetical protein ACX0KM_10180 [Pseudomonas promysalinigenes]|uniref:hypothetical protein n=1 Tax=Pseudomonas putida TaxID=303 RepID=UPI0021AB6C9F|nr:hypothetical protein [Pseudomonas putida]
MSDSNTYEVDLHSRRYSDFDLLRIARAVGQGYTKPVTAFLVNAQIIACSAVGVVFGHVHASNPIGRFADGHYLRTSDIQSIQKEGRFWVVTTLNSRYVLASFRRDGGRAGLRDFLKVGSKGFFISPGRLH